MINVNGKNPTVSAADAQASSITLDVNNVLSVNGKTLTVGSGTSSFAGGVRLQAVGATGGVLHLGGPTTWQSGIWDFDTASRFEVAGTLSIAGDLTLTSFGGAGGLVHVLSGGAINKTAGSGTAQITESLDNDGTVSAQSGKLTLGGADAGTTTGAFTASTGATLEFGGSLTSTWTLPTVKGVLNQGAGTVSVAGNVKIPRASECSCTPTFQIPTVQQNAGTWTVNPDVSVQNYTVTGGTRDGTGTLTITTSSSLSGLAMAGTGTTTVASTVSSSSLDGTNTSVSGGHTFNINSDTTTSGGQFGVGPASAVNIGAVLSIGADVSAFGTISGPGGEVHVLASGTLQKTTGNGTGAVDVPTTSAGTVNVSSGTLRVTSLTTTGGSVDVSASKTLLVEPGNSLTMNGGTLKGDGTVSGAVTNNSGTVAPGASPGLLTITGDYTQGPGGKLSEDITGTALSAFDRLVVGGALTLDGALAIHSGTFTPALTDSFKIISGATSETGAFDPTKITGATVGGVEYTPQYQSDGATLTVNNAPPPPKPSNTAPPSIPATATEGQTITCSPGSWTGSPTFTFEWMRDGSPIPGATDSSYQLAPGDVGHAIACRVKATNASGSTSATSDPVTPTALPPQKVPPTVKGFPPDQGCVPKGLKLGVSVRPKGLKRVIVLLDHKKILTSKKHAFTFTVPSSKLKPGRHKMQIVRFYGSKTKVTKSFSFTRCRGGGRSPRIRTEGTPTQGHCTSKDFSLKVTVKGAVVKTIHMSLDGKKLTDPGKAVFNLAIHASALKAGKHRLTITAADKFKNPTRSFTDFRVCA